MKENNTTNQVFALLAMLALFIAAYFADQWFIQIRRHAAESLDLVPNWWVLYVLGFLGVFLAMSLALWVIAGSARGPMVHWLFFIIGLLVSSYAPLIMVADMAHLLPANLTVPILWGENVLYTARILAVGGLLGLLIKPRKSSKEN